MTVIQIYEPAMCCPAGVCGPAVDPVLARFSADFHWLAAQGVRVERYNLAQQPYAFAGNDVVKDALANYGNECLPLIVVNGAVVSRGFVSIARGACQICRPFRFAAFEHLLGGGR